LKDANSAELKTDLDGKAEKAIGARSLFNCHAQAVGARRERYSWSREVQIKGAEQRIDLTNDNARIEDNAPNLCILR